MKVLAPSISTAKTAMVSHSALSFRASVDYVDSWETLPQLLVFLLRRLDVQQLFNLLGKG